MSNTKQNIVFQSVYEVLVIIIPIITSPYVSRVLGAEGLGIFSYSASIVSYFVLFAKLGTMSYGSRSISVVRDNKDTLSETFWQIYFMQIITCAVASVLYVLYVLFICDANILIAAMQGIELLAVIVNINWLYSGLEKFKTTVMRSLAVKLISTASIFVFVREQTDLWKYVAIVCTSTFMNHFVLWLSVNKIVVLKKVKIQDVVKHIKPNFMLFIPLLAMSVYHIMDKSMIGWFSTSVEGGYYYNADKVINVPLSFISAVNLVLLPKMSKLASDRKDDSFSILYATSLRATVMISIFMATGMAAIANEFCGVFFGPGYDSCILLMKLLSPIMVIKAVSLTIRFQYLVPCHKEKQYIVSTLCGGVANLIANSILIGKYGAAGAVIGTLIAEAVACAVQIVTTRKEIDTIKELLRCIPYLIIGGIMIVAVRGIAMIVSPNVIGLIVEISVGIIVCGIFSAIYFEVTKNATYIGIKKGLIKKYLKRS